MSSSTKITKYDLDDSLLKEILNSGIVVIKHDDTGELIRIGIDSNGIYTVPYTPEVSDGGDS